MSAIRLCSAALLAVALSASSASAQYPCLAPPQAPDACGPGYYCTNACGMRYGPGYCLYPPFPPFQGMVPGPPPKGAPGSPMFPTHPYARSPRDFFMYFDRGQEDQRPF